MLCHGSVLIVKAEMVSFLLVFKNIQQRDHLKIITILSFFDHNNGNALTITAELQREPELINRSVDLTHTSCMDAYENWVHVSDDHFHEKMSSVQDPPLIP